MTLTGCSGGQDEPEPRAIDKVAMQSGVQILDQVDDHLAGPVVATELRGHAWSFSHDPDGDVRMETDWRTEGDSPMTILLGADVTCFEDGLRGVIVQLLGGTYGYAKFEPKPWACSSPDFGMTESSLRTVYILVRATGPLVPMQRDIAPPVYQIWVDAQGRPVKLQTGDLGWTFDYPETVDVSLPAPNERGAYGYTDGPGWAGGKACMNMCGCDLSGLDFTWSDGRKG
jgi:hypothetical protein